MERASLVASRQSSTAVACIEHFDEDLATRTKHTCTGVDLAKSLQVDGVSYQILHEYSLIQLQAIKLDS